MFRLESNQSQQFVRINTVSMDLKPLAAMVAMDLKRSTTNLGMKVDTNIVGTSKGAVLKVIVGSPLGDPMSSNLTLLNRSDQGNWGGLDQGKKQVQAQTVVPAELERIIQSDFQKARLGEQVVEKL